MLLQTILTTISYETGLTEAMPGDVADPLLPPSPTLDVHEPLLPPTDSTEPESHSYPPQPPLTSLSSAPDPSSTLYPEDPYAFAPKPQSAGHLPPAQPIIALRLRHILHRLTSPAPVPPPRAPGADGTADDNLVLPLPNTANRVARLLHVLNRARERRRRELNSANATAREQNIEAAASAAEGQSSNIEAGSTPRRQPSQTTRIPGAIAEEDEEDLD